MSEPAIKAPTTGGSYVRLPDGDHIKVDGTEFSATERQVGLNVMAEVERLAQAGAFKPADTKVEETGTTIVEQIDQAALDAGTAAALARLHDALKTPAAEQPRAELPADTPSTTSSAGSRRRGQVTEE